ncbi:unnamed protein product, partial [Amoebophrya sp. A120]
AGPPVLLVPPSQSAGPLQRFTAHLQTPRAAVLPSQTRADWRSHFCAGACGSEADAAVSEKSTSIRSAIIVQLQRPDTARFARPEIFL